MEEKLKNELTKNIEKIVRIYQMQESPGLVQQSTDRIAELSQQIKAIQGEETTLQEKIEEINRLIEDLKKEKNQTIEIVSFLAACIGF